MESVLLRQGERALSGRFAPAVGAPAKPLVFAIHGGSYTSHYFSFESLGDAALARMAPAAGHAFLAIDRPGYEAAGDWSLGFDDQAARLGAAIGEALESFAPRSAGVFLVGHSIGAMLAMLIAARGDGLPILGLDLSGVGAVYRQAAVDGLETYVALDDPPRAPNAETRRSRMFGPPGTFDEAAVAEDFATAPLSQPQEIREAIAWPRRLPEVAHRVTAPVRLTLGEFDALWDSRPAAMAQLSAPFSRAAQVETHVQPAAGHCNHLHHSGAEQNRATLAFFEACVKRSG